MKTTFSNKSTATNSLAVEDPEFPLLVKQACLYSKLKYSFIDMILAL